MNEQNQGPAAANAATADPAARAQELIATLGMVRHIEGGWYREWYHADERVTPHDGRGERKALSAIHYLLTEGGRSRFHRVASAEAWHYHEGAPMELTLIDPGLEAVERRLLAPPGPAHSSLHVVPAGWWQAARTLGAYTLVGCCCGPCFDPRDFELMIDAPGDADVIRERFPELVPLL